MAPIQFADLKHLPLTLRARIFMSMILIIVISFFLTGAITFYHFKNANEQYHQERLRRKEYAVIESINYFLREQQTIDASNDSIVSLFDDKICELSKVNSMDISIYSLTGHMLISSNPMLREKGLVYDSLTSSLLRTIRERSTQHVVENRTDTMRYLSSYDLIHNMEGKPLAIVNVPYFDTDDIHQQDIQNFLMRLGQIYLLLFLVSILIAYFLANYITGSLNAIGQKLKNIRINEPNPPLEWKFDDEIGTLVNEYNRMLAALEKSAAKLARTERETAWKEMAKQVAHEIKNPLTPMRLSVQYLEKTLECADKEKLGEFTESMISQIDTLSSIADAFSRFASMPEMKPERFNVAEVVQKVIVLYPGYEIKLNCTNDDMAIKGDKDQFVRALNNLINNAIQAIPEGKEPHIALQVENKDGEVLISICDNGTGIPKEQTEKIFEPQFTTKTKGMGLGLAMVKNIVDGFNGTIWLNTEMGKGTTFYISLPAA